MASKALIVVPPFLKYSAGPLLGPALLQSAALSRGHRCDIIDMNAEYIRPRTAERAAAVGRFVGDHDKPAGPRSLTSVEDEFVRARILPALAEAPSLRSSGCEHFDGMRGDARRRAKYCFFTHDQVAEASANLAGAEFGRWAKDLLTKAAADPPDLIGITLLHAGQVIPSAAITEVARRLWPRALVAWGGPHVSGLGKRALNEDLPERSFAADVFVTGHAEETFVDMLNNTAALKKLASGAPVVLEGKTFVASPVFGDLGIYDAPVTFPAQSSTGCAYGRCSYCTYPGIEGRPKKLDLGLSVAPVVEQARRLRGATLSLKDSLVTPQRLAQLGEHIQNRVRWSACTKLSSRLDFALLARLADYGLATLEVGVETLLPESQRRIRKVQPQHLYEDFLANAARLPDISIVVNYMVGLPWEDPDAAHSKLHEAQALLRQNLGEGRGLLELNEFELERLAPMAKFPDAYGIDPTGITKWPWASVLDWRK